MRIACLCRDALPSAHTNSEQLISNAAALARTGIELDLLMPSRPDDARPLADRAAAIAAFYGMVSGTLDPLRPVEIALPAALRGDVRRAAFDVRAAARTRSGYDIVYVRERFTLWATTLSGAPVVYDTYRTDINTAWRYAIARRVAYRRPNLLGVIAHSKRCRDSFLALGFPEDKVLLAYNGVEPSRLEPRRSPSEARARLGLPLDRPLVLYTGHVNRQKGTDVLPTLARRLPEADFVVVGGSASSLEPLPNLREIGRVPPAAVADWLFAADVLVIPPTSSPLVRHSRTVLPMKTFLYLAAGRPILAPDLPDLREVLEHGRNAFLVKPEAPDEAVSALRALFADSGLRDRLSRAALADARRYTWDSRARLVSAFLHRLTRGAAPR